MNTNVQGDYAAINSLSQTIMNLAGEVAAAATATGGAAADLAGAWLDHKGQEAAAELADLQRSLNAIAETLKASADHCATKAVQLEAVHS